MFAQFLFQSLVLFPTLNFILGRKKYPLNQRLGAVIILLSLVLIGMVVYKTSGWEKNYFELLGVPRSADARDIKQAYRKISFDLHPDKNPSKEAADLFLHVSKAHTTLTNDEFRDAYDRWGEKGLKWVETSKSVELQGLIDLGISMFSQIVLVYMLTTSVSATNARSYSYGALGVMMVIIAGMRFAEEDIYIPFHASMTRDQKCDLLYDVFGVIVLTIGSVQRALYFDLDEALVEVLRRIEIQQSILLQNSANSQQRGRPVSNNNQAVPRQDAIPPIPPRQRFSLPEIPSWAYLLLVVGISQYFGKEK